MKEELWKQIEDEAEEYGPFNIKMVELETLRDILFPPNIRTVNTSHEESVCPECGGVGIFDEWNDTGELLQFKESPCPTCHGTGKDTEEEGNQ